MVRSTDHPVMTITVDWDVKQQNKQTNHGNCCLLFLICTLVTYIANIMDPDQTASLKKSQQQKHEKLPSIQRVNPENHLPTF